MRCLLPTHSMRSDPEYRVGLDNRSSPFGRRWHQDRELDPSVSRAVVRVVVPGGETGGPESYPGRSGHLLDSRFVRRLSRPRLPSWQAPDGWSCSSPPYQAPFRPRFRSPRLFQSDDKPFDVPSSTTKPAGPTTSGAPRCPKPRRRAGEQPSTTTRQTAPSFGSSVMGPQNVQSCRKPGASAVRSEPRNVTRSARLEACWRSDWVWPAPGDGQCDVGPGHDLTASISHPRSFALQASRRDQWLLPQPCNCCRAVSGLSASKRTGSMDRDGKTAVGAVGDRPRLPSTSSDRPGSTMPSRRVSRGVTEPILSARLLGPVSKCPDVLSSVGDEPDVRLAGLRRR